MTRSTKERYSQNLDFRNFPVWWDEKDNILIKAKSGQKKYVMVQFEKPLMEKAAEIICRNGGNILNIGFGCGLVDTAIQKYNIKSHTIVEAHPQVYEKMLEKGWGSKPGVTIIHSKWQDVDWSAYYGFFDGIFWDPYFYGESEEGFTIDLFCWFRVVQKLIKPETGVFINYQVPTEKKRALRRPRFFDENVETQVETCEIEVPFVIPEWKHLGKGKHKIYLPYHRMNNVEELV